MKIGFIGLGDDARLIVQAAAQDHMLFLLRENGEGTTEVPAGVNVVGADTFATECEIVFTSFKSGDGIAVFAGDSGIAAGFSAGTIIADLTTGSPEVFRDVAGSVKGDNVILADVAFTGYFEAGGKLARSILASGPRAAVDRITQVLALMGFEIQYCGAAGNARALHLVNTTMSLSNQMATLEVVAMGQKLGLTVDTMAKVINAGSGRNMASRVVLPALVAGESFSGVPMAEALDTISLAVAEGADEGLPMITASIARGLLQAGVHRLGSDATMDGSVAVIESFANAKLTA